MMAGAEHHGGRRGFPWRLLGWGTAGAILLAPAAAMQFTHEVAWTGFDFAFAAGMLGLVGLGLELAFRSGNVDFRVAAAIALALGFVTIWFTGAVGVIGSEGDSANLLFGAVLAVALAGAVLARFRAAGMAWAMGAAAVAQVLVPVVAAVADLSPPSLVWAPEVLILTSAFTALWLASAWLFRRAVTAG